MRRPLLLLAVALLAWLALQALPGAPPPRPLQPVALAWLLALALAFPRDRGALAVLALSVAVRAATASPRVLLHFAKAYGDLLQARGHQGPDRRYGDAWVSLTSTVHQVLGPHPDVLHLLHLVISAALPPFLHDTVRRAGGAGAAALLAGGIAATLPLAVALAPTETKFVLLATLQVTAVAGALRRDATGDLLAALSLGLLAHGRPLQLPTALAGVALLAALGRRPAALAAAALVGWRVVELARYLADGGTTHGLQAPGYLAWPGPVVGPGSPLLALDPTITPLGVTALAGVGAAVVLARRDRGLALLAFAALALITYASQHYPSDRLRFQLPSMAWLAALAGVGAAGLLRRHRGAGLAALAVVALTWWPARAPLGPRFVWQAEYEVLRDVAHRIPPGRLVRFAPGLDPDGATLTVIRGLSPVLWLPLEGEERIGELRWVGAADRLPGARPVPFARLDPVVVRRVPARWGDLLEGGDEDVWIGLYQVVR